MLGGGFFVATSYWYLYLTGEAGVRIDLNIGSINSVTEGGAGPLKIEGRDPREFEQGGVNGNGGVNVNVNDNGGSNAGLDMSKSMSGGGGSQMGGWLTDLRDDGPYSKSWKEREMEKSGRGHGGDEKV